MASLAAVSLLAPDGGLASIWSFKQAEFRQLRMIGPPAWTGFLLLALLLATASWGCFDRRRWGWALGFTLIAVNAAGDLARITMGNVAEGLTGLLLAGALLWWLSRPPVRACFQN